MKKFLFALLIGSLAACTRTASDLAVTPSLTVDETPVMEGTGAPATVTPTATLEPLAVCENSLVSRLRPGIQAQVDPDQPLPNNLRSEAGTSAALVGAIQQGEAVTILSGPICIEDFTWWNVRKTDGTEGWTAEADDETYWLVPLEGESASTTSSVSSPTSNRNGLTWGVFSNGAAGEGIVMVGCAAGDETCNSVVGDTSCNIELPVLCYKPAVLPRPNYALRPFGGAQGDEFYNGWAAGYVGLTAPVSGASLGSLNAANNLCEAELGAGYRMAESHDGKYIAGMGLNSFYGGTWPPDERLTSGGEAFYSYGSLSTKARFWVYTNDQAANCWDPESP